MISIKDFPQHESNIYRISKFLARFIMVRINDTVVVFERFHFIYFLSNAILKIIKVSYIIFIILS